MIGLPGVYEMTGEEKEKATKISEELMDYFLNNNIGPRYAMAAMIFQMCVLIKAFGGSKEDLLQSINLTFDALPNLPDEKMGG